MCNSFALCSSAMLAEALRAVSGGADIAVPVDVRTGGIAFPGAFAPVIMAKSGAAGVAATAACEAAGGAADAMVAADVAAAGRPPFEAVELAPRLQPRPARLFPVEVRDLGFGWPVEWKRDTLFNARLDSLLAGKEPWENALAERRCVLPCDAFFESHRSEMMASPRTGKPMKRRYRFLAPDGGALLLAAVWEDEAFSVVTTEPNAAVAPIHDRMPLVLTAEEARLWLDPCTPLDRLAALADRSAIGLQTVAEGRKLPQVDQPELPF